MEIVVQQFSEVPAQFFCLWLLLVVELHVSSGRNEIIAVDGTYETRNGASRGAARVAFRRLRGGN